MAMLTPTEFRTLRAFSLFACNRTDGCVKAGCQHNVSRRDEFSTAFARIHLLGYIIKVNTTQYFITHDGQEALERCRQQYRNERHAAGGKSIAYESKSTVIVENNQGAIAHLQKHIAMLRDGLQLVAEASPMENKVSALVSHAEKVLQTSKDTYGDC